MIEDFDRSFSRKPSLWRGEFKLTPEEWKGASYLKRQWAKQILVNICFLSGFFSKLLTGHMLLIQMSDWNIQVCARSALPVYLKLSCTGLFNSNPSITSSTLKPLPEFSFCYISIAVSVMTIFHCVQVRNLGGFYCFSPPLIAFHPTHHIQTLLSLAKCIS